MRHLFASRVEVLRLSGTLVRGNPIMTWVRVTDVLDLSLGVPGELLCRIDLQFQRPGKDQPMPVVAGRAPDRLGVLFCSITPSLLAGDRLHCIAGPVNGTFEIRTIPDPALNNTAAHHLEVQVVEVAQSLTGPQVFPGGTVADHRAGP